MQSVKVVWFLIPLMIIPIAVVILFPVLNINPHTTIVNLPQAGVRLTYNGLLLVVGVLCLFFENYKASSVHSLVFLDLIMSMLLVMGLIIAWFVSPSIRSETLFILITMQVVDSLGGVVSTVSNAMRSVNFNR